MLRNPKKTRAALWIVACELAIIFAGSTLPTPLYLTYCREFGFSEITLTLVYAVYVLGNLFALFIFGRLSDQVGRKATSLPALGIAGLSTLAFCLATNTSWLFAARVLSGFATGLGAGAATAWIAELHPRKDKVEAAVIAVSANFIGLALGPLVAGLLAAYAPLPLRLAYFIYAALLVSVAVGTSFAPETVDDPVHRIRQISIRPRLGVPSNIRSQFVAPAVTAFGIFSLIGFYSALVPGVLVESLQKRSPATAEWSYSDCSPFLRSRQ